MQANRFQREIAAQTFEKMRSENLTVYDEIRFIVIATELLRRHPTLAHSEGAIRECHLPTIKPVVKQFFKKFAHRQRKGRGAERFVRQHRTGARTRLEYTLPPGDRD